MPSWDNETKFEDFLKTLGLSGGSGAFAATGAPARVDVSVGIIPL